jgi:2-polyprenyl-3-methyl-5-hydroxy-6-metoxy-1,4-benzoquinol methylase
MVPPPTSRASTLKDLARRLAKPLTGPIDGRVADINRRVASSTRETGGAIAATTQQTRGAIDALAGGVHHALARYAEAQLESNSFVGAQLRGFESALLELRGEADAVGTAVLELRAELHSLGSAVDQLVGESRAMHSALDGLAREQQERVVGERFARLASGTTEDLDAAGAKLLNYAASHRGFAAQEELWLNPPLVVEHGEREVRLSNVNERIVEIPFALSAISHLTPGARVLDFGSSESSLALSLASLGFEVTALDVRRYPFEHPRLEVVASPIEQWEAEPESFDAALCVSTLEHVGLGWYGDPRHDGRGDRLALDRISDLLKPGGILVLTLPYGAPGVDDFQRRYDRAQLDELIDGWEVIRRLVVERIDERTWQPVDDSDRTAVAMVTARKPVPA